MRASIRSSHVGGDFSSGQLAIEVVVEDDAGQVTLDEVLTFDVPPDFHTHNDSVAAAMLALLGTRCPVVRFNFPISVHCAEIMRAHYGLRDVGPVDPSLTPRRPGPRLGLNFSGGLDSVTLWTLLREWLHQEVVVVSVAYGGPFEYEEIGFRPYCPDLVVRTNVRFVGPRHSGRFRGFGRTGRFMAAVPLLVAHYLDLGSVTSATYMMEMIEHPLSIESLRNGVPPSFVAHGAVYRAGGLTETYLFRPLITPAIMQALILAAPERVEPAFRAASVPGDEKHVTKGLLLRLVYERLGLPVPALLDQLVYPRRKLRFGETLAGDKRALLILKHYGPRAVRRFMHGFEGHDFSWVHDLSLELFFRYNTNHGSLIPEPLRAPLLETFHELGIYPYDERDWRELDILREFFYQFYGPDTHRRRANPSQGDSRVAFGA